MGPVGIANTGGGLCSHHNAERITALHRRLPSRARTPVGFASDQLRDNARGRLCATAARTPVTAQQPAAVESTSSAERDLERPPDAQPLHREPSAAVAALKEWAVTCAALGAGQQMVVLRKGGIREPAFTPVARHFLLFPTSFHSGADLVQPRAAASFAQELQAEPQEQEILSIEYAAEVTGAWTTANPAVVTALDAFHVWTPDYLNKRLRWRRAQPITVLELRCRRLRQPLQLRNEPELWGCFSWITLPASASKGGMHAVLEGATVVVPDAEFSQGQAALREATQHLGGVETLNLPA